jgi:hypothetical protein
MKKHTIIIILAVITLPLLLIISCKKNEPVPMASTVADFSYEGNNSMTAPTTVTFANHSIMATSYLWDFGNGETSSEMEPTVTYDEPGTYVVTLTVGASNEVYYNQLIKQATLQVKDPTAGKTKTLYFTDRTTHSVRYAVLNDEAPVVQDFGHTGLDKPYGMVIDTANARVIVSDYRAGVIYSYDLQGFDLQVVIDYNDPNLNDPFGLEVIGDKLYWGTEGAIGRCNMDGSGSEIFIPMTITSPPEMAIDIAWDHVSERFFFSNDKYEFSGGMYHVDFNGNNFTELVSGTNGGALDIDLETNSMYYADMDKGICKANFDGSDEMIIAPEMADIYCWGLAIDHDAGKIYWSDKTNGNIMRSNLDGSDKEVFISNCNPYAIAIDTYR